MNNGSLLQSFALDKSGRIRSVEEVARGLACECVCPACGESVIARQGEVREWHFAHSTGADCPGAGESALHRAAKQVLVDSRGMTVPVQWVQKEVVLPDGRGGKGESTRHEAWTDFSEVESEKRIGSCRPDIVAMAGSTMLVVEIAVTHFIDDEKQRMMESAGIPVVEIDLGRVERHTWTWGSLKEAVVEGVDLKRWICQMDQSTLDQEAHERAVQDALEKHLPAKTDPPMRKALRTRFMVDHWIVDVIDRPYCISVWSPYNPEQNMKIKPLMRMAGGRWDRRMKNWVFPMEAGKYLREELEKMSGMPPELLEI